MCAKLNICYIAKEYMEGLKRMKRKKLTKLAVLALPLVLSGCVSTTTPRQELGTDKLGSEITQGLKNNETLLAQQQALPPGKVSNALIPPVRILLPSEKTDGQHFDIAVKNAPAQAFFASLVKDTNQNIIVNPKVAGNVTLDLKNVTIEQIMEAMRDIYGFEFEKNSYGYVVYPPKLETKMFTVNYLNVSRSGLSETSISSGQISNKINSSSSGSGSSSTTSESANTIPASTVSTETDNNFWNELTATLNTIVNVTPTKTSDEIQGAEGKAKTVEKIVGGTSEDGQSVVVNPQAGVVVIKAFPHQLREVQDYLDSVQKIMNREVIIDAKILEVNLDANFESGIDWSLLKISQNGLGDLGDNLKSFTGIFNIAASGPGQFSALIRLLNTQGRVNVLSSPRISTINNQKAVIKVGSDEFFVTGVESNTDTSSGAASTSDNIDLTPFFSGVALDVTPEIDQDGQIILHIHPIVSEVTGKDKKFTVSGKDQDLPLAFSTIRESDSIVRVKNKQVVVIGGLMENSSKNYQGKTPLLSNIPIISGLFKRKNNTASKTELVILLQPVLANDNSWNDELKKTSEQFKTLTKSFSFNTVINTKSPGKTKIDVKKRD
jgi:MSHA biogenesis protein MshL